MNALVMKSVKHRLTRSTVANSRAPRRGAVLVWFAYLVPYMLTVLTIVADLSRVSQASTELKTAVDAAALSGVKSWIQRGTQSAVLDASTAFEANRQLADSLAPLSAASASQPHGETTLPGDGLLFGSVQDWGLTRVFQPLESADATEFAADDMRNATTNDATSSITTSVICLRIRRSVLIPSFAGRVLRVAVGSYTVSAESYAWVSPSEGVPQLIHVDQTIASSAGETFP